MLMSTSAVSTGDDPPLAVQNAVPGLCQKAMISERKDQRQLAGPE